MYRSWARALSAPARCCGCRATPLSNHVPKFYTRRTPFADAKVAFGSLFDVLGINGIGTAPLRPNYYGLITYLNFPYTINCGFCTLSRSAEEILLNPTQSNDVIGNLEDSNVGFDDVAPTDGPQIKDGNKNLVEFTKVDVNLLPTVILVGRPNVGKSALFNRLIRRREALVYNTPDDHVTRDFREGIAKLGDLRFRVLDSAGLEMASTSGSILGRTADMTANVLARSQFAIFLIDVRAGLHPMDLEVGKWLRRHAPGICTILVMNKSESLDDGAGLLASAAGEAYELGFGDPIAISAETGLGMAELYEALRPLLEEHMLQVLDGTLSSGDE